LKVRWPITKRSGLGEPPSAARPSLPRKVPRLLDASGQGSRQKPIFHGRHLAVSARNGGIWMAVGKRLATELLVNSGTPKMYYVTISMAWHALLFATLEPLEYCVLCTVGARRMRLLGNPLPVPSSLELRHLALMPDLPDLGPWQRHPIHPQGHNQAPMSACQPLNRRLAEVSVDAADSQPATASPDNTACFAGRPIVSREPPCLTSTVRTPRRSSRAARLHQSEMR
jgi:hypothetical protein